mgnify:FL=1
MVERGRKPGFRMSEEHRVKIQNSNILNALVEHVEGKREMTSTQVSAGIALLKKVMPDLSAIESSIEHSGEIKVKASKEQRDAAVAAATRANG